MPENDKEKKEEKQELILRLSRYLDTLEEYENKVTFVDYANLYRFMDNCASMYGVSEEFRNWTGQDIHKMYLSSPLLVARRIVNLLRFQNINPDFVPLIPILEYKLVPTGNILYFDLHDQEKFQREQFNLKNAQLKKKCTWRKKVGAPDIPNIMEEWLEDPADKELWRLHLNKPDKSPRKATIVKTKPKGRPKKKK